MVLDNARIRAQGRSGAGSLEASFDMSGRVVTFVLMRISFSRSNRGQVVFRID